MKENGKRIDYLLLKRISVLYVEDDKILREKVLEFLRMRFDVVYSASDGRSGLETFLRVKPDVVITDIKMPVMSGLEMARMIKENNSDVPVIILTAFSEATLLMEAIEIGVDGYVQKPADGTKLLETIYKTILPKVQRTEIDSLNEDIDRSLEILLGKSRSVRKIIKQVRQVTRSNFSVVLQGETGVGKTLLAQTIHDLSKRSDKPFVTVDIGSMPETLVESELFGYKKGAFTGASRDKKGYFEAGCGGTVFLDELENMTPYVQAKLLRAVEEKKIFPLGGTKPIKIDIRIICAVNKDLAQEVKENRFRHDLYYRLSEFTIQVPPLRERKEDIPMLARKFFIEAVRELESPTKEIDPEAVELLKAHRWDGNVRELKNAVRRMALISERKKVTVEDVLKVVNKIEDSGSFLENEETGTAKQPAVPCFPLTDVEKWAIQKVLTLTNGKKLKAASLLQIDYKTLANKMKKYDIP
jgi:DNA-binding NtrC family response regulator